jgi:diguanylate cyclase (GGDEF)-like protein
MLLPIYDLPNRAYLLAQQQHIIQYGMKNDQAAVMMVDVNDFKAVNEKFGHGSGDLLLKVVGRRLQQCLRQDDTIVRLGGDEFCIILAHTNKEQALEVAQKILAEIAQPLAINNHNYIVGLSMGIAMYPKHGEDTCVLVSKADRAMQYAKRRNLDVTVFESKLVQTELLDTV